MATQKQKQAHAALRSLVQALEGGAVRPFDLRPEDGPTVWPLLVQASGGTAGAVSLMHLLEGPLSVSRGTFFLSWARRQTDLGLLVSLQAALDSLCGCGGVIADPEDASVCSSCEEDQAIFDHEVRMEERGVR